MKGVLLNTKQKHLCLGKENVIIAQNRLLFTFGISTKPIFLSPTEHTQHIFLHTNYA